MDYSSNREISAVASLYSDLSIMTELETIEDGL